MHERWQRVTVNVRTSFFAWFLNEVGEGQRGWHTPHVMFPFSQFSRRTTSTQHILTSHITKSQFSALCVRRRQRVLLKTHQGSNLNSWLAAAREGEKKERHTGSKSKWNKGDAATTTTTAALYNVQQQHWLHTTNADLKWALFKKKGVGGGDLDPIAKGSSTTFSHDPARICGR